MRIVMLSATFPYPPTRGGTQCRTFNLLKYLSQNHEVTLLTQDVSDLTETQVKELKDWVKELVIFPRPQENQTNIIGKIKRFTQFWLQGIPPNVLSLYSLPMQNWLDEAISKKQFDIITCEHSVNQIYVRPQWQQQLSTVIDLHSSLYRTCKNQLETNTSDNPKRDRLYLPLLKRYEQTFCQKFSHLVVTTNEDQEQFQSFYPDKKITIIPNGVDLEVFPYRAKDPGGYNLIITGGMDYIVNIDAACFFALEIFPLLQEKYPEMTLTIVGSKPAPSVLALAERPGITVTGRVPSMVDYLHQATICVIPMRSGFGMKIKTLEAMASGVPIVASDRALEGLEIEGSTIPLRALRANRIEEYINAITHLFEDPQLRETLSQNARQFIEQEYTWEQAGKNYEKVLRE